MYRNILKIITVFFVMLALIVPVTLEKLPAINEKYDMAKALEDNVLQNYVKASSDAKQEKNPDEILQEKAGFEDDLRIELPDDSEGERQSISVETDALTQTVYVKLKADVDNYFTKYSMTSINIMSNCPSSCGSISVASPSKSVICSCFPALSKLAFAIGILFS